ncbi:hypothetical protein [uncultured Chitinophaga sp.]|jgi:hypothetical protein|uniref:hypothetical protein n=1 Tax=uncultured Chitinophaga sp. TaxID=339340 RepID=UPI002629057C|nr:hypothetical protein [uncultured Chitinophaga sp.]
MKQDLFTSIKRLGARTKWLRRISISVFLVGLLLSLTARIGVARGGNNVPLFVTLGFIGYILIISSAAILLLHLLKVWSARFEV